MTPTRSRIGLLFTWLGLIVALIVFVKAWGTRPATHPTTEMPNGWIGTAAPDFTLPLVDGGVLKLSSLKGQVVVLDFWAVWCPPCVEELPRVAQITSKYADKGVHFYAINMTESPDAVRAFLRSKNIDAPVALAKGSNVTETYGIQYIPLTVVIDANGIIRHLDNISPSDVETVLPNWIESTLQFGQSAHRG
ncbi:MAG: TlpA family protein disulfide reductase [Tepidisphaeraceae bacterium]